jgi:hypothetical protein
LELLEFSEFGDSDQSVASPQVSPSPLAVFVPSQDKGAAQLCILAVMPDAVGQHPGLFRVHGSAVGPFVPYFYKLGEIGSAVQ